LEGELGVGRAGSGGHAGVDLVVLETAQPKTVEAWRAFFLVALLAQSKTGTTAMTFFGSRAGIRLGNVTDRSWSCHAPAAPFHRTQ
jgi:hypothetical protein